MVRCLLVHVLCMFWWPVVSMHGRTESFSNLRLLLIGQFVDLTRRSKPFLAFWEFLARAASRWLAASTSTTVQLPPGNERRFSRRWAKCSYCSLRLLKPGGCYMLTCSAPPGLHTVMALVGLPGGLLASGSGDTTVAVWRVAIGQ